jgi:hypothetical protein
MFVPAKSEFCEFRQSLIVGAPFLALTAVDFAVANATAGTENSGETVSALSDLAVRARGHGHEIVACSPHQQMIQATTVATGFVVAA